MMPHFRSLVFALAVPTVLHAQSSASRLRVPQASAGVTAFTDVNVVPMDTDQVLPRHTVLVKNGRITTVGPSAKVPVPKRAMRIDGRGKYLMPGLGDCHGHIGVMQPYGKGANALSASDRLRVAEARLFRYLTQGITTMRNMDYRDAGNLWLVDGPTLLRLRAQAAAGEIWSPRIYTSGQWGPREYQVNDDATFGKSNGTPLLPAAERPPLRLDSVAAYIAAYKAAGYDFVKVRTETPEVFDSVLAAAHRVGIPVAGHVPSDVPLERALAAGMRSIEHLTGYYDASNYDASNKELSDSQVQARVAATKAAGVWQCVTATLYMRGSRTEPSRLVPSIAKTIKAMQDAGVGILAGVDRDPILTQEGIHRELEELVNAGLTPYQALAAGTTNLAVYLNTLNEAGTVVAGKRADLVLLNGDPLADIRNTRQLAGVMIGGRWLPWTEMDRRSTEIITEFKSAVEWRLPIFQALP